MAGKQNRRSGKSNWPNVNRWKAFNEARSEARQMKRNAAAAHVDQNDVGHVADGGASADVLPGGGGFDQNCHPAVSAPPCVGMGPDVDNLNLHVPVDGEVPEAQTNSGTETSTKPGAPGKSTKKRRRFSFKEVSQKLRFYVLEHSNDHGASSRDSSDDTLDDFWSRVPRVGGLLIGGRYFSRARRVMDSDTRSNCSIMDKVNGFEHCPPELADALEEVLQERSKMRLKSGHQAKVCETELPGGDAAALRQACRKWLGLANFDIVAEDEGFGLQPPVLEDDADAEFR